MYIRAILFSFVLALFGCQSERRDDHKPAPAPELKNLILIIGDGMGPQQVGLLSLYATHAPGSPYPERLSHLDRFLNSSVLGLMLPVPAGTLVTDSGASASQLATGEPARAETIGVDASGEPRETILEKAKKGGKSVGIVTDVRVTDATPAAFAAHAAHRSEENEIALRIVESGADVVLGGGLRHFLPQSSDGASKRKDDIDVLQKARELGYDVVLNRDALAQSDSRKVLGLFAMNALADGIEHAAGTGPAGREPGLKEMTAAAINVLSQNPKGFFLMVEGGQIDWAAHRNDAGTMLAELRKLDETLAGIVDWAKEKNDTLIVLTADHETGSFGLSYSAKNIPAPEPISGSVFEGRDYQPRYNFCKPEVLDQIASQNLSLYHLAHRFQSLPESERSANRLAELVRAALPFPFEVEQARKILRLEDNPFYVPGHRELGIRRVPVIEDFKAFYPDAEDNIANLIAREIAADQCVVWGTGTHTSTPVLVAASGPNHAASRFAGIRNGAELGKLLQSAFGM